MGSSVGQRWSTRRCNSILTIAFSARAQVAQINWNSKASEFFCMLIAGILSRWKFFSSLTSGLVYLGVSGSNHVFYSSENLSYLGDRVEVSSNQMHRWVLSLPNPPSQGGIKLLTITPDYFQREVIRWCFAKSKSAEGKRWSLWVPRLSGSPQVDSVRSRALSLSPSPSSPSSLHLILHYDIVHVFSFPGKNYYLFFRNFEVVS